MSAGYVHNLTNTPCCKLYTTTKHVRQWDIANTYLWLQHSRCIRYYALLLSQCITNLTNPTKTLKHWTLRTLMDYYYSGSRWDACYPLFIISYTPSARPGMVPWGSQFIHGLISGTILILWTSFCFIQQSSAIFRTVSLANIYHSTWLKNCIFFRDKAQVRLHRINHNHINHTIWKQSNCFN